MSSNQGWAKEGNAVYQLRGQHAQSLRPVTTPWEVASLKPHVCLNLHSTTYWEQINTHLHTPCKHVHTHTQMCTSAHNTKPIHTHTLPLSQNATLPESGYIHLHTHANTKVHTHMHTPIHIHLTLYFHLASDLLLVCSRISSFSTSFCVLITSLLGTLRTFFVA